VSPNSPKQRRPADGAEEDRRLFATSVQRNAVSAYPLESLPDLEQKLAVAAAWASDVSSGKIKRFKEEEKQRPFLDAIFRDLLGYTTPEGRQTWNLRQEQKTKLDATKADGALGFYSYTGDSDRIVADVRAVIELKGPRVRLDSPQAGYPGKPTPIEQAFGYVSKMGSRCRWVLVSNFRELRLYHHSSQARYASFDLGRIHEPDQVRRLVALLSRDQLLCQDEASPLERLYERAQEQERERTARFYGVYSAARETLFESLRATNPEHDPLELLRLTQRIIDRVLFVCFAEDRGFIDALTLANVIKAAQASFVGQPGRRLWAQLQGLFGAMNSGQGSINGFGGALFADDPGLTGLSVSDEGLRPLLDLGDFDFESELGVTLLGHCFEQSISDLEEMANSLTDTQLGRQRRQRQREGIFYTPSHITSYMVEEALGGWMAATRRSLGFDELPLLSDRDLSSRSSRKVARHLAFWTAYSERLAQVRVLDMACGSGAFLVAVLERLRKEATAVNEALTELRGGQADWLSDMDPRLLGENIYGVDVSADAVQISRLSLWLKTVSADAPLTALDGNIRAGNSLVEDRAVADDAFPWDDKFEGKFDVIVGNPPYDVLSELETGAANIKELKRVFKEDDALRMSFGGKQNLYKLFVCRMIDRLADDGWLSVITPMSLMGDLQAKGVRQFLFDRCTVVKVDAFPQKDDPARRVFRDAKLSTCIVVARSGAEPASPFGVRTHPADRFEAHWEDGLTITGDRVMAYDPVLQVIPSCSRQDWAIVDSILAHPAFTRLGELVKSYQGEVNETDVKKAGGILSADPSFPPILRGANLTMYAVRDASQGQDFTLDELEFLRGKRPSSRAFHAEGVRVGFQRSSPQNNFRRIIAAPIKPGLYCFDTVSYITEASSQVELDAVLGLLNSRLWDFWFRLTSTNSKVNEYQFNNLPWLRLTDAQTDDHAQAGELIAAGRWSRLGLLLEQHAAAGRAPRWLHDAIAELSRQIAAHEAERILASRRERSRLGEPAARLQRHLDSLVYSAFGLDKERRDHIDKRLEWML